MHLRIVGKTEKTTPTDRRYLTRFASDDREKLRVALRNLHVRFGTWQRLADALDVSMSAVSHVLYGRGGSFSMAVRTAKVAGVSVERLMSRATITSADRCPSDCGRPVERPVTK